MNLLVITQKVDRKDPVSGFFHSWIIELARHFDKVTVIGLYVGSYSLPANVRVLSLGKEQKESRFRYVKNFYTYIIAFAKDYDAVFVHQNQEYPILGGLIWKIMGKRVYMWRNHYAGSLMTDISAAFCDKIFCTSKFSFTAKYKKTAFMPVGVDTDVFIPKVDGVSRMPGSILSIGRIAPSKKIDRLVEALGILKKEKREFVASIYGSVLPADAGYLESLKSQISELGLDGQVSFKGGIANEETPAIYSAHDIFVNLSPSGMFDKTIFEAMSCETVAISCNQNLVGKIDGDFLFEEDNLEELAQKIGKILSLTREERDGRGQALRQYAKENHSLSLLGSALAQAMTKDNG